VGRFYTRDRYVSVLQCVAVGCSGLQWVAVGCSVLRWVVMCCSGRYTTDLLTPYDVLSVI